MNYKPCQSQCDSCIREQSNCLGNIEFRGMPEMAQIHTRDGDTTIVLCNQHERQQEGKTA